ncbi:helix-turn-helix transcriptional regulator [Mycobacterium sp. E3198]|uniref:helix-turn-helix domain-containing protein n=1 Tax=Mycobacterium sp. E3198 TaxID=1834143 RepID=UPI0009EECB3A|nr:helix-turn-helix transcriptional regulator [Mycobacterium sp. E3198]
MTDLLVSDPDNRDESTSVAEAWTQSFPARAYVSRPVLEHAYRVDPQLQHVYHVNPSELETISPHYVVLVNGVMGTGVDLSGAQFVLCNLAGWTCPAAITAAVPGWADDEPEALRQLRRFHGFWGPALDAPAVPSSPQEMVRWLHEESGLTWDQLARTLGVSRRSVHAWANGQRVSGRNLERLSHVYSTIKEIDASSAEDRRHALFSPRHDMQPNLFDQLVIQARKAVPPRDENALLRRLGIAPAN